ncbi:MAG: hypothetical protein ACTSO9_11945 [Candidatus Helarchaeota archaeon]
MSRNFICKLRGCDFVIKDNVEFCRYCGKVKDIIPPMCEIVGACEWVQFNGVTFCPHCGREKEEELSKGAVKNLSEELVNG